MSFRLIQYALNSFVEQRKLPALRLMFLASLLSVFAIVSILSLTSFLKEALNSSSSELLAADRQVVSPRELDPVVLEYANQIGLRHGLAVEFRSMVFSDSASQLVSVKAVDNAYPLLGSLQLSGQPQGSKVASGNIAMQSRLNNLLNVKLGDSIGVGDADLLVGPALIQEPDIGFNLGDIQPRLLMRLDDLAATQVVQPGSRVKYRYYFAGDIEQLRVFDDWIVEQLDNSQRYEGVADSRPAIAEALQKAEAFLLLSSCLAALLSSLAISLAARQYSSQQIRSVAILKTLGLTGREVVLVYVLKLGFIGLVVVCLGLVLGQLVSGSLSSVIAPLLPDVELRVEFDLSMSAVLVAVLVTVLTLFGSAIPQVFALSGVKPMAVLRPEEGFLRPVSRFYYVLLIAVLLFTLAIYTQSILLLVLFVLGSCLLMVVVGVIVFILARSLEYVSSRYLKKSESGASLAVQALVSQRGNTFAQCLVYAFAFCLFASIFIVRESLIAQWQQQIPENAPNHFLINITEPQVKGVKELLASNGINVSHMYPMVRGRMSHINGEDVKVAVTKDVAALNRELNLSWVEDMPEGNEIVDGAWVSDSEGLSVSVEQELTDNIGVSLGDSLTFNVAGLEVVATVSSIRKVDWESMKPNFYVLFKDGALNDFPNTYIASFYLPEDQKTVINELSRSYPTVSVLELDLLIGKIQSIVNQVSTVLSFVLYLILAASVLVIAAITLSKISEREHQSLIYRVLGVRSTVLQKAYFLEFFILGFVASLAGFLCAEAALNAVSIALFGANPVLNLSALILGVGFSSVLLGFLGFIVLRRLTRNSLMQSLR
ncbi:MULTISPECIES: ABC transporter permease [unclassified Oleiphilus]|uniref:ABC transporter permease n=1 Tax=unclassified Oleiphilus TaxID=2631174 RepID=UPI0007C329D4|nr:MULTISPECIES: FtsX-like permease family protein [unclassified Oleiphilus]KZY65051.1 hypothetical protein A3738_09315 [Oleiphilus sp. HI0066]KZY71414.1 hypothetical protein A3739_04915 [Oleiphilus sp. HI0067]